MLGEEERQGVGVAIGGVMILRVPGLVDERCRGVGLQLVLPRLPFLSRALSPPPVPTPVPMSEFAFAPTPAPASVPVSTPATRLDEHEEHVRRTGYVTTVVVLLLPLPPHTTVLLLLVSLPSFFFLVVAVVIIPSGLVVLVPIPGLVHVHVPILVPGPVPVSAPALVMGARVLVSIALSGLNGEKGFTAWRCNCVSARCAFFANGFKEN